MNNTKGKERRDNKSRRLCLLHKKDKEYLSKFAVVPHAGTWIEIDRVWTVISIVRTVVPHAGTWIEISLVFRNGGLESVVPHAGTWIEIVLKGKIEALIRSFPTRERGLKFPEYQSSLTDDSRSPRGNVD